MALAGSFELLMNKEFIARLHEGIDTATERVFIQVMTFDGDPAGLGVADRLIAAAQRGVDVRLTVDLFAFRYISDVRATSAAVMGEAADTHDMFDRLEQAGVAVTYVGPWGPLFAWAAVRNHKKIFVVDSTAYLGGINISDHNFEWLDFTIGIGDQTAVSEIVSDFEATRRGEIASYEGAIVTNENIERTFDEMIRTAKRSIVVASPYALDLDLDKRLSAASAPAKTLITPQVSNMGLFRLTDPYMRERLVRNGVQLTTFEQFFHAKFLLVDEERLLVGSSNFGRHSFRCNQEIGIVIEDRAVIRQLLEALPPTRPIELVPTRLQQGLGLLAEYCFFAGLNLLERTVVSRAPVLASR